MVFKIMEDYMGKAYSHLTQGERCHIYDLKESGFKPAAITAELGKDVITIRRELKWNSSKKGCHYQQAHSCVIFRRSQASQNPWKPVCLRDTGRSAHN